METKEKVIIFGRGMVYLRKKEILFRKYEIVLFLDNSVSVEMQMITDEETGVRVVNPATILDYPEYPIIVLSYAVGDMCKQLLSLGVMKERIRFGVCMQPFNTFESMLFEDGVGKLYLEDDEVIYQNDKHNLRIVSNSSSLEDITVKLRNTPLYTQCTELLEALPLKPIDDTYGMNRGMPIDRYYIEKFLEINQSLITGTIMEIGDREYTLRFGKEKVHESVVLHVKKCNPANNMIQGDFATGEGIEDESVDCLICTQTLPFIYDIQAAARNIVRSLKKGGKALITVAGISQIISYEKVQFGHFWSFTDMSLQRLFADISEVESIEVQTFGNVKSATAFLYGICSEEMNSVELEYNDPSYQLIIAAVVTKKK